MEISGINNKLVDNSIKEAKSKVEQDDFEKRLQSAMDARDEKELKKACKDFEGIFLKMMYKQMKATVPQSDLLPSDSGKEIFDSMLDDKLMEEASSGTGVGLGDMLYKQMTRRLKNSYRINDKGESNSAQD